MNRLRRLRALAVLLAALAVAGCAGSAATPTAASSASPAPASGAASAVPSPSSAASTPSAAVSSKPSAPATPAGKTPSPAATFEGLNRFVALVASPEFQGAGSVAGTANVKGATFSMDMVLSGSFAFKGDDYSNLTKTTILGQTTTDEAIAIGQDIYIRDTTGKWQKSARTSASSSSIRSVFSLARDLKIAGTVNEGGKTLYRLVPSDPSKLTPEAMGVAGSSSAVVNPKMQIEFLMTPSGEPVRFRIWGSYQQEVQGVPATLTMDEKVTFSALDGVTIAAPSM